MHGPFLAASAAARALLDDPTLAERWDGPSVLELMTVGELAGHLSRAVTVVPAYLATPGAPPFRAAPEYFLTLFPRADPDPESEMSKGVRARAMQEARAGPDAVREAWDRAHADLQERLDEGLLGRGIAVHGSSMRAADYLVTRMVELVIHSDDLAASLDVSPPRFDTSVTDTVLTCLTEMAARRHGTLEIIRALSRTERADPSVLRVF